jgi:rhamnosyltransferase
MKILFVGAGYPPGARGGTEIHMRDLAQALRGRGHELSVFCREGDAARPDYAVRDEVVDGVAVRRVNYAFRDASDFAFIHENPRFDALFAEHLSTTRPDLVHFHHLTCLSTSLLDVARRAGAPTVMTLHDFWTVCPRGQRITAALERCETLDRTQCAPCLTRLWPHFTITPETLGALDERLRARLDGVDLLISPSEEHRRKMLEFGLDPARHVVVAHGLASEGLAAARRPRTELRRVGFIGSVIPSKGVHVLVEAFRRAAVPGLTLDLYGDVLNFHGDVGYGERLRSAAGDAPVVLRGGYDPEALPGILRDLDLLVVPSLWRESFCLTAREAFLAGVPVLASRLGGLAEAFVDGEGGRFFAPGDVAELALRLRELATDDGAFRALAQKIPAVRTLASCAAETEARYASVVAARASASPPAPRTGASVAAAAATAEGRPYATVFIPTWNGGPLFETVLDKVLAQKTPFPFEVLVIDSGSRDGTVEAIKRRPAVRLIEIPNTEFNHGLTRNRAVREARGEIVALLTQDAEPYDDGWLARLVSNFDDPEVAGAYCHQHPRPDCNPFQRDRLRGWTKESGAPEVRRLADPAAWDRMHPYDRYRLAAFDDVASCVRKSAMETLPFAKRQFGEDVEWGKRAILAGKKIVMDPGAVVIHSHDSPVMYEFKRVYLDHQNLNDLFGLRTIPRAWMTAWFSFRYFWSLLPAVWRDDRSLAYRALWTLKLPLYAFTQNLAQYLGAKSAQWKREGRMEFLDRWLRKAV